MTEIKLHTYGERLIVSEKVTLSSGNVNSAIVVVEFDEIWKGYPNKCAIFSREGKDGVEVLATQILDTDGNIVDEYFKIPPSVLKTKGVLEIGIRGDSKDGGKVLTSTIIRYNIERGANLGTITLEPDMDLYRQYLASMDASVAPLFDAYRRDIDGLYTAMIEDIRTRHSNFQQAMIELTQPNILWTNSNTGAQAGQTYSISSLKNYNHFLVIFHEYVGKVGGNSDQTVPPQKIVSSICQKNTSYTVTYVDGFSSSSTYKPYTRTFSLSDTALTTANALLEGVDNNYNSFLVPYQIIGWV